MLDTFTEQTNTVTRWMKAVPSILAYTAAVGISQHFTKKNQRKFILLKKDKTWLFYFTKQVEISSNLSDDLWLNQLILSDIYLIEFSTIFSQFRQIQPSFGNILELIWTVFGANFFGVINVIVLFVCFSTQVYLRELTNGRRHSNVAKQHLTFDIIEGQTKMFMDTWH